MESQDEDRLPFPEKLGPYRPVRRLGSGSMGEVYEAVDDRLDRRVAIKRLAPAATGSSGGRQRLREEARTAARLNHPCLVQIYDLLEENGADYLVLELVEGRSLQERLADGPLSADELLSLARDLAEGLLHAHQRGILHRDLKPANVLMTRDGRAKIADFGIARDRNRTGEDLTEAGAVVGTYRYMSPEQARGLPLDQRSDLFSLGLVLYEAATGSNPFAAENPLAALRRIAKEEEPSLSPQRPDLPPVLLSAVHRLLAKSRELRPQSAGELLRDLEGLDPVSAGTETVFGIEAVAWEPESRMEPPRRASSDAALSSATEQLPGSSTPPAPSRKRSSGLRRTGAVALLAGLLLLAAFLLRRPAREPAASLVLAVPLPRVVEGLSGEQLELVPGAVRFAVLSAMTELEGVSALAAAEVDTASGSPSEVARTTRADEVLDSELDCRAQRCWVTLSRLADGGQRLVWTERLEVPADNLYLVAQAVAGFLRQGFPELRRRPGPPPLEARPRDYEEFLRLERDFRQKAGGLGEEVILSRLKSIRESSPRFLEAYLLAAEIRRLRFVQTRKEEDLDRAFSLVEETRRLAPRSPRPLYFLFNAALVGGRLDLAEATLRELEALDPGAVQLDTLRAHLLEARGEGRAALVEMRRATERRPSVLNLSNLAEKEFLLGEIPESRRHLLQALELSPKDHTLHSRLASLELMAGDPARAVELYGELVERNPGFAELSNLGLALLLESRFGEARDRFRQALELAPRNVFALLNLADAEWLSGGEAGALELYRRLLQAIEEDPAAVGWQFLTVKAQALAHLGRGAEALEAIAEAQRRAPDNPQVAYESALVLTLTGDLDTARTQAMRALDQGYDARWFSFPWFDSLRQDPEVLRRLNKETEKPPP